MYVEMSTSIRVLGKDQIWLSQDSSKTLNPKPHHKALLYMVVKLGKLGDLVFIRYPMVLISD
jgi:hypothetical protein